MVGLTFKSTYDKVIILFLFEMVRCRQAGTSAL